MRPSRHVSWYLVLVWSLGPLMAGCVTPDTVPPASDRSRSALPTADAPASAVPTSSTEAPATAIGSVVAGMVEPPQAWIAVEGGDPVMGELGSFTWHNSGSSSPGLDGTPIHVGAGEPVTLALVSPVDIDGWRVSRVRPGNHDRVGAISIVGGSGEPVTFEAPVSGSWSVEVQVSFAGNLGSAAYYWRMDVD